jgi:hypothetical protein
MNSRFPMLAAACLILLYSGFQLSAQQQIADPDFVASVENPAYESNGPIVAIDQAHSNLHTAEGQYKPFADLLAADGFRVVAWTGTFDAEALAGIDVLVVANARDLEALMAGVLSSPAFTDSESDAVRDWVRDGGSLLLIADHAPFGHAAEILGERFGIAMGKGWVFDHASSGGITTQLEFSTANGLLGDHPILRGRNPSEAVTTIRSFTGQSLGAPEGAAVLMKLGETAREASTPDELNAEDAAARGEDGARFGTHSFHVGGRAQGLAMRFGRGKVVALGEAAMLSAQIVRYPDGRELRFGMNVEGNDNRQFALNVVRWLSGLLDRGVAEGSFEVVLTPESVSESGEGASIGRMSLRKIFHGDLEGTGSGEMLMVRTAVDGSAGYVAIERFAGRLGDRTGSFLLQHYGILDRNEPSLRIEIIPDSGTGDLSGITGTMSITIDAGHFYRLDYSLREVVQ